MSSPQSHEEVLNAALRDLPWRRAPVALEARLTRYLQQQHSAAGWRGGYSQWPTAGRVAFLILGIVAVAAISLGCGRAAQWLQVTPGAYVSTALTVGATLYAALFGLSAAAYHILYANRPFGPLEKR